MTAGDTKVVAYDYFAERMGVKLKTVHIYAAANDPLLRIANFPKPVAIINDVPYFDHEEADTFIDERIEAGRDRKGRMKAHLRLDNTAVTARVWTLSELTDSKLVGYEYFAKGLDVKVNTIRDSIRYDPEFPTPDDYVRMRGRAAPRFQVDKADAYIKARNKKRGDRQRGRARGRGGTSLSTSS